MSAIVSIDGSYGEGGGQIIRTALSLAAITGRAVEITSIRAGRERPGLQPQHLAAVRAAAALCEAVVEGAAPHSTRLSFHPRNTPRADHYHLDIGTSGATTLVLQTALLPLAFADGPSQLCVTGGTHVPFAPTIEYVEAVYLPLLRQAGFDMQCDYTSAGYRQRGGGRVTAQVSPAGVLQPITFTERGKLLALKATIITSELPEHVSERGAATVEHCLRGVGRRIEIEQRQRPSAGAGAAVIITATCEQGIAGFSSLGERGKPMERVAEEACKDFLHWWKTGAACDEHLADQLVLPTALIAGESCWTVPAITQHLHTVAWVVQHFLPISVEISENTAGPHMVRMHGVREER